ncbi:MAG: hypothetical protein AB7E47_09335 [Desulfovibrionaceae bacterium]
MNLYLDMKRNRVVYQWNELQTVVMDSKSLPYYRCRAQSMRVSPKGRLNKKDLQQWHGHPALPKIKSFVEMLKGDVLTSRTTNDDPVCMVCGGTNHVFPHLAHKPRRIVWLCGEHRYHLN